MRMRHILICGPPRSTVFFHHLINDTIFGKKLLNTKWVFWFPLQVFPRNISHSKKNVMLSTPYSFQIFDETWVLWDNFFRNQILKYQISWKSVQWELSCSRRTYRHNEEKTVALPNLANEPKNCIVKFCISGMSRDRGCPVLLFRAFPHMEENLFMPLCRYQQLF